MPYTKGTVIAGRLGCLEFDRVHFRGGVWGCVYLMFVSRRADGEGRLNRALSSRGAGRIKNERSKYVCSNILRKMMLHLP